MHNKPQEVLCDLIAKHGNSLAEDKGRCSGLLRDYCSSYKVEINILITAMEEQVPNVLINRSASTSTDVVIAQLVKRLQDDRGLTVGTARWAVESWALALGVIDTVTPTQPEPQSQPQPQPQQVQPKQPFRPKKFLGTVAFAVVAITVFAIIIQWQEAENQKKQAEIINQQRMTEQLLREAEDKKIQAEKDAQLKQQEAQRLLQEAEEKRRQAEAETQRSLQAAEDKQRAYDNALSRLEAATKIAQSSVKNGNASELTQNSGVNSTTISETAIRKFVESFIYASNQANVPQLLNLYADEVSFYKKGVVSKYMIQGDKENYYSRWPEVRSTLRGIIDIKNIPENDSCIVVFDVDFETHNYQRNDGVSGEAQTTLKIKNINGELKIVAENQIVLRREKK